jgi:hypothetical protein
MKTSILAIGMGGGPLMAGMIRDATGSFHPLFVVGVVGNILCVLLVIGLGPFPDWEGRARAPKTGGDQLPENDPIVMPT